MFQTIRVSSCVSIQGEFVESLTNGQVVVRDGGNIYRGQPIRRSDAAGSVGYIRGVDLGRMSVREGV